MQADRSRRAAVLASPSSARPVSLARLIGRLAIGAALTGLAFAAAAAPGLFTPAGERARAEREFATNNVVAVRLDAAELYRLAPGSKVDLAIPGGTSYVVVLDRVVDYGRGVRGWEGHLDGTALKVTLSTGKEGTSGVLATPAGNFRIGYLNGLQLLVRDMPVARSAAGSPAQVLELAPRAAPAGKPPVQGALAAEVNLVGLTALEEGDTTQLTLPGGQRYNVRYDDALPGDAGTTTWVGHLADYGTDYRVMLTYGPAGTMGTILTPDGEYKVETRESSTWLIDVKRSGLVHAPQHHDDQIVPEATGAAAPNAGEAKATQGATTATAATTATTTSTGQTTIDLLILYTPGMSTRYGAGLSTRLDQLVALANQAYRDSGVAVTLRRVAAVKVNYSDTATPSTALSALANGSDPALANTATLRSQYGADLVTLIRPFSMQNHGGVCGVGYIGGYMGYPIANYARYGYSVVGDGTDVGGTRYYCMEYTLAHELGHNMGSMHDRATVKASSTPNAYGAYTYGFGYGLSGSFGTLMSYINPRIGKFSNPALTSCGAGQACGVSETNTTASANNALSLNNTRTGVAGFMATKVGTTYTISGTVSAGTMALAGVSVTGSGASCTASGTNGAYSCTVPAGWSGTLTPSLAGYGFTPANRSYSNLGAAQASQGFTATKTTP